MEQLIKVVNNENGNQVVSARELYTFLQVNTDFTNWCKRMFAYGFEENQDYIILAKNGEKVSKSNPVDFALTLDTAKQIAMLQRSDKGKIAREYFIECEKRSLNPAAYLTKIDLANMIIESETEKLQLKAVIAEQAPKAAYTDNVLLSKSTYLTTQIANELGMTPYVLNNTLKGLGVQYKRNGQWVLYANHLNQGLTDTETELKETTTGKKYTAVQMKWTERGREYIHWLLNDKLKSA